MIMNIELRRMSMSDAGTIAQLANNKKIWDNVRDQMPFPFGLEHAETFINRTLEEEVFKTFGIFKDGLLCGVIGLHPQKDVYRLSAELGYWIGESHWGKGLATQAVKLMVDYGFNKLDLIRIYAGVFEYNEASMKVLEKNGFEKECILRKAVIKNGKIWNEHRYAIIKN